MAVGVVDGLEVVDIDERDRQRTAVAGRPFDFVEQGGEQGLAVGDAGEPVVGGSIVRIDQRRRDVVDGAREAPLLRASQRLDVPGVIARGDPLGGLDEIPEAVGEVRPHDDRGEGDAEDGGADRGHAQPDGRRQPCRCRFGDEQEQDPDPGGGPERQDPEHTTHTGSLRSGWVHHDPAGGTEGT